MKINVISINRQHLLDLSKGLIFNNCDVVFYTMVPISRCKKFGLAKEQCYSLFLRLIPYLFYYRIKKNRRSYILLQEKFANLVLKKMRKCDIVIINGYGLGFTADIYRKIQKKGTKIIMEWGSKHIKEERKAINGLETYPKEWYKIAIDCYSAADIISIPATHVKESFIKHGIKEDKLFINPYGANLDIFQPTTLEKECYELIMTGCWSYRKGCDLIIELCKKYGYKFLHVGSIGDIPFPANISCMKHIDAVNEYELPQYYAKGKVFVLPSRTEGLALVQAQAFACGLPLVCSQNTGGSDLAKLLDINNSFFEMQTFDVDALHTCVERALIFANTQHGLRVLSPNITKKLSWSRYGETYKSFLYTKIKK